MPKRKKRIIKTNLKKRKKETKTGVILVLAFIMVVFFIVGSKPQQQQYMIVNGQQVPLTAIPKGFSVSKLQLLQIELCTWQFMMRDADTDKGIPDVHVKLTCDELGEHGEASVYTNKNGYGEITLIRVDQAHITATHPYYETREGDFSGRDRNVYVDWNLTPKTGPGELVKVTLYAQVDKKSYVIIGSVNVEGEDYDFDRNIRPQKAVMWLQRNTLYTMYVDGWYNAISGQTGYNPVDFSYTIQIETSGKDEEYWVDLLTGDLHGGKPPTPEDVDWWKIIWDWLTSSTFGIANWMFIVVGVVALYALPHVASLAKTLKAE